MTPDARRNWLRRAAGQAWAITVSYAVCGIVGVTVSEALGPRHPAWSLGLAWLFCLVSCILVFPCGLAFCALGSFLVPSAFERRRPWREILAGILIAAIFYSGLLERVMRKLESWSVQLPFGRTVVGGILIFVTPFAVGVTLGCWSSWLLPPGEKARIRQGRCGEDILPPGASRIAK